MPQRHRYATRAELAELVATEHTSAADVAVVLDGLAEFGVPVDALVKCMVDADTDEPLYQELEQGKPHLIPALNPVNTCETDADAARRFADNLDEARQQLELAWGLIANVSGGNWGQQSTEWQHAAANWRDRWLGTPGGTGEDKEQ